MGTVREILEGLAGGDPVPYLQDPRPEIRRLAVAACAGLGSTAIGPLIGISAGDSDDDVRAEALEVLGGFGPAAYEAVRSQCDDSSVRVAEAATTALGEIGDPAAVPWLLATCAGHEAPLVREAAIAALGAIGDDRAVPALLEAVRSGKPQIRRRAVVALTAFDGPEVEAAVAAARLDRNPMVREVAEMVLGREVTADRPVDG
ncbi:MAG: HEAT repeat domain-containing protein [Acidimicrobiia bacterium]|nr:HEAT repeat domain-containing protein [Acidimicrobiia bacterium]